MRSRRRWSPSIIPRLIFARPGNRRSVYYFKCKKTKLRSLKIGILEIGNFKKLGPEAAYVLSTIRE